MFSVCIPVYNVDVRPLVRQLSEEIPHLENPVEILIADDGSEETYLKKNREIKDLTGISYSERKINSGRAAIRNHLGSSARYPWLLFLDADSLLPGKGFLKKYLDVIPGGPVICGGTSYHPTAPEESANRLRWKYGIHREQIPAERRSSRNKFAITSNNFLISRELFLQTGFREEIREYGHEDTVLGYDLFLKGIKVTHIDNPVIHTGLETSVEYLNKTRSALKNLLYIKNMLDDDKDFIQTSGLLSRMKRLETWNLDRVIASLFALLEPLLVRNLTGPFPSLFLFDLYRLGYLCENERQLR